MFERFTADARMVVVRAQEFARRWENPEIAPQHLLAALAQGEHTRSGQLLAEHHLGLTELTEELTKTNRRAGITDAEADALREFGIDVDAVVRSVESTHGENALWRGRRRPGGRLLGRFGDRDRGHIPFAGEAKRMLERTLREALELDDRELRDEHILLALLGTPGVCADLLAAHGMDYTTLRRQLAARRAS